MILYNSASRKREEFVPYEPGKVSMYTCGPTVYHFAHIGNLRTYIMEDILDRYLRYSGYDVRRVMNITDVGHLASDADEGEDKMLKGARREHKSVMEIAKFYTDAFFADCDKLHIRRPDIVQPATGCIPDYIHIIQTLMDKGYAYFAGGNVYFDTSKLEKYYIFNEQDAEDLAVGVRESVEEDTNKKNRNDFVLWFTKSKFEDQALKWDSPWGVGYPGWHIECSGISMKYLGEHLDIHCGGIDNAFPHHTNEIAQSESYLGHPWCRYWMHVLHLNTTSGKMSKSKGEFLTVSLLEEKGYDPMAYRFFCLQSHYRKSLVFTWENLDNAALAYGKLVSRIAALNPSAQADAADTAAADALRREFADALDNDLNTSLAVTAVYDVLKAKIGDAAKLALIGEFDRVLALDLCGHAETLRKQSEQASGGTSVGDAQKEEQASGADDPFTAEILSLIEARKAAKKQKDFAEADRIRNYLAERGVTLVDTKDGTTFRRS
jgi:cysteinyl-tRNA synthetase